MILSGKDLIMVLIKRHRAFGFIVYTQTNKAAPVSDGIVCGGTLSVDFIVFPLPVFMIPFFALCCTAADNVGKSVYEIDTSGMLFPLQC